MVNKYIKILFKILGSLWILGMVSFLTLQSSNAPNLTPTVRSKRETVKNNINEKIWNKITKYLSEFTKIKISKLHYSYLWNIANAKDVKKELSINLDIFKNVSIKTSYEKLSKAIKKEINKIKLFIGGDQKIVYGWLWTKNTNNGLRGNKIADSLEDNQPHRIQDVKDKTLDEDIDVVLEKLLEKSMNDALNNLKIKFWEKLKTLINAGINQFTINNILYDFNLLLKEDNLQLDRDGNPKGLIDSQLPDDAKNQLLKLVDWSFNKETFDEAVLQEIDRKDKFIEIILKFNKWRKINKVTIKGENYPVEKIRSDDAYISKDNDVLKQINKLMKIQYIDEQMLIINEQMLIKACFFEVLQFNWRKKLDESELKEKFKKHLTDYYSFTPDSELPKEFTDIIFEEKRNAEANQKLSWLENRKIIETLETFVVAGITKVKIRDQTYSLNVSDEKTNSNDLLSPPLYLNSEWENLKTNLLESYLEYIKPSLKTFKTNDNKIVVLMIDEKSYSILNLLNQLEKKYSVLTDEAKGELKVLSGLPETKKKLETYKTNLETKKKIFEKVFKNLELINIKKVSVDNKNYSIKELQKTNNIDSKYSKMSPKAQKEFTKLFNNGVTEKKLTEFYENKLNLAVLKSIKLDIEKSLNAILKEKSRLINAGIMLLSFTNGEKANIIIDITHYIDSSKKKDVNKQKYQLLKLRNKNIKKIVDQNIDQDFLEKWQIWKKKSKILKNLKINKLEFVDESTKEKTNINLDLYQVEKNKEKPSEINELSTLKELSKTRKISVEKFKNLINATIQKQNDKILLKKQLTQKNDQKTLTIGLAVGGSVLTLGMFSFGIGWFLKFRAKS